jgi:hypothetical protein
MTAIASVICIILGMGSLAWGYAEVGLVSPARWLIAACVVWLYSQWRRWKWYSSLALLIAVLVAGFGLYFEISPGWMVSGALFSLAAWDLADYHRRMELAAQDRELREAERRRIARLSLILLVCLGVVSLCLLAFSRITLDWIVLLVVAFSLGLLQLLLWKGK